MSAFLASDLAALTLGLILGLPLGAVAQRTHFCTMGALSDRVLFGSVKRLRAWALAAGVALLGTQLLLTLGPATLEPVYLQRPALWAGAPLGGLLFGVGMVLGGGCALRNLARGAAGSLKGLVTALVLALVAWSASDGFLAWFVTPLRADLLPNLPPALPQVLATLAGPEDLWRASLTLVVAVALIVWALRRPTKAGATVKPDRLKAERRERLALGLTLGAVVPLAYLAEAQAFGPSHGVNFVLQGQEALRWAVVEGATPPRFGTGLVVGIVGGAFVSAVITRTFRWEGFANTGDTGRHLIGGALMGLGGALAHGGTIGQGVSGVSTLALGSFVTLAAIVAGAVAALRYMLHGPSLGYRRKAQD